MMESLADKRIQREREAAEGLLDDEDEDDDEDDDEEYDDDEGETRAYLYEATRMLMCYMFWANRG